MTDALLQARGLTKVFGGGRSLFGNASPGIHAVQDVSIAVDPGETLGIVGESGCGKSTLARMLVGLTAPSQGEVAIGGTLLGASGWHGRRSVGRAIQYVFQDPVSALNPRHTVSRILEAPLKHLRGLGRRQRRDRVMELMDAVGLRPEFSERYPHEFSGGQAQRIGIARALAADPRIIVLDEPVSALDVSVQAQILNLLAGLKQRFGLTYVFISHDLAVIEAVADRVAVMYFGRVVEEAPAEELFADPRHPYTRLLLDSAPILGRPPAVDEQHSELPDPLDPPLGCAFANRCGRADAGCRASVPPPDGAGRRSFACFHPLRS